MNLSSGHLASGSVTRCSFASGNFVSGLASRRGMTLTELLVAVAVASVFLIGVVTALSAVMNSADRVRLEMEANRNGSNALEQISIDLAQADVLTAIPPLLFAGGNSGLPTGNLRDDDNDLVIDEETWNGADDDGDGVSGTNTHVLIRDSANPATRLYERPLQFNINEVSDIGVDEDNLFEFDDLTFIVGTTQVHYEVGTFDGRDNVLIREETDLLAIPPTVTSAPVAYDVLSLNFLYFDPNWTLLGSSNPWRTDWNSLTNPGPILYPVAVHASISVYSGNIPLAELAPTALISTVDHETIVLIEGVLNNYYALFP